MQESRGRGSVIDWTKHIVVDNLWIVETRRCYQVNWGIVEFPNLFAVFAHPRAVADLFSRVTG